MDLHGTAFSPARVYRGHLFVTHDLLDAVALADRMIVIRDGVISQSGTPAEVTTRPRSRYVADLVGVNLLRGLRDDARPYRAGRRVREPRATRRGGRGR
jgi:ABC-type Fe3+/spermidine/putrescine transport system ATPase subunit